MKVKLDQSPLEILIVDDEPVILESVSLELESFGLTNIETLTSGKECIDKFNSGVEFDILLLDIGLPDINGKSIVSELRNNPDINQPVIMMITGNISDNIVDDMLSLGADDFLAKPFSTNVLKRKMESLAMVHNHKKEKIQFLPIRPSTFQLDKKIPFEVFFLHQKKYRLLLKSEDIVQPTHIQLFKKYDVKKVYIEDMAEPEYQKYLDSVIDELLNNSSIHLDEKAEFLSDFGKSVIKEACINPTEENVKNLENVSEKLHRFLEESGTTEFQELLRCNKDDSSYRHSLKVTSAIILVINIIIDVQNNPKSKHKNLIKPFEGIFTKGLGDENFKILTDAAMLHDIGENHPDENDTHHSIIGSEMLSSLDYVNPKVAEIILHHEEFCDGSGKPSGINRNKISLLAKILSFANFLEEKIFSKELSIYDTQLVLKQNESKFMTQLVELFKIVLK